MTRTAKIGLAVAVAPFAGILSLGMMFNAQQGMTQTTACGPPLPADTGARGPERDAGGGVIVGGKWHYPEDGGPQWTPEQIARKADSYGLPGVTFAQIARGESNYHPYVVQHDPGDGNVGFGFFQFTPNAWHGGATQRKLDELGGQRGLEDIEKQFQMARWMYIQAGHSISPWHGTDYVTDPGASLPQAGPLPTGITEAACTPTGGAVEGSPKHIIDTIALPIARACGVPKTVAEVEAANTAHKPLTSSGNPSDHKGPPDQAWAADLGHGSPVPTPEMDCTADRLAERLGISWTGAGLVNHTADGYRYQLIYRAAEHYDHVHLGIRRVAGPAF